MTLLVVVLVCVGMFGVGQAQHDASGCDRVCTGIPRVCEYKFTIEWYWVLSRQCEQCPFNATHCQLPGCVAANGYQRPVMTVNRQIPGPSIVVCEGDTVVIEVDNELEDAAGISIHWHGQHMRDHQYMDGVGMLTQCDIGHKQSFTYRFPASTSGSHWYHSHSGLQRSDGVAGAFIVRETVGEDVHHNLYDHDLTQHVILINDWAQDTAINTLTELFWSPVLFSPQKWALINGRGAGPVLTSATTGQRSVSPREVFEVAPGGRYRFRVISAVTACVFTLFVQGHDIQVIAADGHPVEATSVGALTVLSGERYDFVLHANHTPNNYWLYVKAVGAECGGIPPFMLKTHQAAIIRYTGAPSREPAQAATWDAMVPPAPILNPYPYSTAVGHIPLVSVKSVGESPDLGGEPDSRFYIGAGTEDVIMPEGVPIPNALMIGNETMLQMLNGITFDMPPSPPLSQPESLDNAEVCSGETRELRCGEEEYCICTHMLSVPLGDLVEIIFIDENHLDENHPMHLHGYNFGVLGMGKYVNGTVMGLPRDLNQVANIREYDEKVGLPRNLDHPPLKDTVSIPAKGYTIIRFRADNPGYWFLHCHIEFHAVSGMALVLKVGEDSDLPPVPEGFPRCGDFNDAHRHINIIYIPITIITIITHLSHTRL